MGNIVTNRINFERRDGTVGVEAFRDVITRLTPTPVSDILDDLGKADSRRKSVVANFDMGLVKAVPSSVSMTSKPLGDALLGLALLSGPKEDLVMQLWESRDPAFNDLPPNMVMTAHSVLSRHGLSGVSPESRDAAAETSHPGALEAGRAALAAYRETGLFDAATWQHKNWGMRAHGPEVDLWFEEGSLCVKFDTVNSGPSAWVEEVSTTLPDFHFSGVSYDEDTDYSLHFVTDDPGEVLIEESFDEDRLIDARAFVSGMTADEMRSMFEGEDDQPGHDGP